MHVTIRRGTHGDASAVAQLYQRARKAAAEAGSIPPSVHPDHETEAWIARATEELELWVAEFAQAGPVGMLLLNRPWIDQLYVDPELTGRGIGTQLLNLAKRESPVGLRLWTFVPNVGAQRFYERHGFVEVERTDGSGNEEGAPDIQYALGGGPDTSLLAASQAG